MDTRRLRRIPGSFPAICSLTLLGLLVLLAGCRGRGITSSALSPGTTVAVNVEQALTTAGVSGEARKEIATLYGTRGDQALWLDENARPSQDAREAVALLAGAGNEGLDPVDYDADALQRAASTLISGTPNASDAGAFDVHLTASMLTYFRHVHHGRLSPKAFGYRLPEKGDDHDFAQLLVDAVTNHTLKSEIAGLMPQLDAYAKLREQLPIYRALAADGSLTMLPVSGSAVKPGGTYDGTIALHHLLTTLGDLPADTPVPTDTRYDGPMVDGVKHFQTRHGLTADGVLGKATVDAMRVPMTTRLRQIELSLERLRWLPHIGDGRLIAVNIPMFRLWAWDAMDRRQMPDLEMGVIVGKAIENETPVFTEDMRTVVFRPYWNVPASIVKAEILPAVARNHDYLERNEMEIVDGQSDAAPVVEASPAALERLEKGQLRLRQRPGPHNSLGAVKFVFPNDENVYLHGTPATQLFDRARRDFSHGCIRVEDPAALAEWVLRDVPMERAAIEAAMQGETPKTVPLKTPVQVVLYYVTALVTPDGTGLHFADDIYRSDATLDAALARKQYEE